MKILVVTDLFPICDSEKQTPRTILDFVNSWKELGHNVKIIKPNFLLNSFIRRKPFYKSGIYGDVENINYFLPFCGKITNKIKTNFKPDIVIAHMPSGIMFANKLGLPFVAGVHISDIEVLTNPIYSVYFKSALEAGYRNAKKIACRSQVIQQKFLNLYPEYRSKTFVAYSGIDTNIITRRTWENKNRILTCGKLIKRKNIDKVISACKELKLNLTVIGDGPERKKLMKISSNVNFKGHISHTEVLQYMQHSDVFILPSKNETFGMVYLEALASGCVTIGLEQDGIDGIIKHGENGYLATENNLVSLLKIITTENQDKILKNAYMTISNYTLTKAAVNYLNNIS